jgi:hypothetical protein
MAIAFASEFLWPGEFYLEPAVGRPRIAVAAADGNGACCVDNVHRHDIFSGFMDRVAALGGLPDASLRRESRRFTDRIRRTHWLSFTLCCPRRECDEAEFPGFVRRVKFCKDTRSPYRGHVVDAVINEGHGRASFTSNLPSVIPVLPPPTAMAPAV